MSSSVHLNGAAGRTLSELRLPADSVVITVLRHGSVLIPNGQLRLQEGDRVQLITTVAAREAVLTRFAEDMPYAMGLSGKNEGTNGR